MYTVNPITYVGLDSIDQISIMVGVSSKDPIKLLSVICETLHLDKKDVLSPIRKRQLVEARSILVGLTCMTNPTFGLKNLGVLLDNRHHTTIIHLRKIFNDLHNSDKVFTRKVNKVLAKL